MSNTNFGLIAGRLTKDGEKKVVGNGVIVVDVCVASSIYEKDAEYPNYFYFSIFGKQAENLYNNGFLKKGQFVNVKYHLKQDRWEKDGKQMSMLKIITENIEIVGYPSSHSEKNQQPLSNVPHFEPAAQGQPPMPGDSEIPFEPSGDAIF